MLRVPATLAPGEYILGFRYDCEATAQGALSLTIVTAAAAAAAAAALPGAFGFALRPRTLSAHPPHLERRQADDPRPLFVCSVVELRRPDTGEIERFCAGAGEIERFCMYAQKCMVCCCLSHCGAAEADLEGRAGRQAAAAREVRVRVEIMGSIIIRTY
eukprot:COSAG01_NODE_7716_length_3086_cov_5.125544_1_plen_159_part_00